MKQMDIVDLGVDLPEKSRHDLSHIPAQNTEPESSQEETTGRTNT